MKVKLAGRCSERSARAAGFLETDERSGAGGSGALARFAPFAAHERAKGCILSKLLVRVGGFLQLAAEPEPEPAAEPTPLLLSHRLSGALRKAQCRRAERGERGGFLSRLGFGRPPEVLLGRGALRQSARGPLLILRPSLHFGAFTATSATFEGLHRTGTGLYVSCETAQRPGLRESAHSGFRVGLGCRAVHRNRNAASCTQGASCGRRIGGSCCRETRDKASGIRSRGPRRPSGTRPQGVQTAHAQQAQTGGFHEAPGLRLMRDSTTCSSEREVAARAASSRGVERSSTRFIGVMTPPNEMFFLETCRAAAEVERRWLVRTWRSAWLRDLAAGRGP